MFSINKKFKTYNYHSFQLPSVHSANLIVNKMVRKVLFNYRIYILKNKNKLSRQLLFKLNFQVK